MPKDGIYVCMIAVKDGKRYAVRVLDANEFLNKMFNGLGDTFNEIGLQSSVQMGDDMSVLEGGDIYIADRTTSS